MTGLLLLSGALALVSAGVAWVWIEEPTTRVERRNMNELLHLRTGLTERARNFRSRVAGIVDLTRSSDERLPGASISSSPRCS